MPNATVWAMSALSITVGVAAVYFAIFFLILYAVLYGVLLFFKAVKGIMDFGL